MCLFPERVKEEQEKQWDAVENEVDKERYKKMHSDRVRGKGRAGGGEIRGVEGGEEG